MIDPFYESLVYKFPEIDTMQPIHTHFGGSKYKVENKYDVIKAGENLNKQASYHNIFVFWVVAMKGGFHWRHELSTQHA